MIGAGTGSSIVLLDEIAACNVYSSDMSCVDESRSVID